LPNSEDRRRPVEDHAVRDAFQWLGAHTPSHLVLQHNPDFHRAYGYALYGRHRVAIADRDQPILLGAPMDDVRRRLDALIPVFAHEPSGAKVAAVARRFGVDVLVVTSTDPIWRKAPKWLVETAPLYRSQHVRALRVGDIAP
jgi:hypothetical protein